jgi:hypothetical protein
MPDIMVESQARDFTTTRNPEFKEKMWKIVLLCFVLSLSLKSCSPDLQDDPIPRDIFDPIEISLNLPEYVSLQTDGGWKYYNGAGVRGIIIYRANSTTYLAFERNCSYRPNDACATIDVDQSQLFLIDPCCSSTFNFEGTPTGGPAWRPLLQYETTLSGTSLTITDVVVN